MKSMNLSLSSRLFVLGALGVLSAGVQAQISAPNIFQGGLETLPNLYAISSHPMGSVLKVKLDTKLQSNKAHVGDTFTATVDMGKSKDFFGLPAGTKVEGHVTEVRAREGKTPGMLSVDFDTVRLANGERYPIEASLIKFDKKNILRKDGRYMSSPAYSSGTNYVATGAVVGVGLALLTGADVLLGGLLGAGIGYLIGERGGVHAQDLTLKPGTVMGVRFNQDTHFSIVEN